MGLIAPARRGAGVLEEAGIEVHVHNESLQGALGEVPEFATAPRLLIPQADARRAHELLKEFDESAREGRTPSEIRRVGVVMAGLSSLRRSSSEQTMSILMIIRLS